MAAAAATTTPPTTTSNRGLPRESDCCCTTTQLDNMARATVRMPLLLPMYQVVSISFTIKLNQRLWFKAHRTGEERGHVLQARRAPGCSTARTGPETRKTILSSCLAAFHRAAGAENDLCMAVLKRCERKLQRLRHTLSSSGAAHDRIRTVLWPRC